MKVTVEEPLAASRRTRRCRTPAPGAAQPDPQRDRSHAGRRRSASRCGRDARATLVEIDVEDDGPGFPAELPVFDAFFTTKVQGTGLGLSLAHRIVADHGGTLQVQSRPGKTCFTVGLPITERS